MTQILLICLVLVTALREMAPEQFGPLDLEPDLIVIASIAPLIMLALLTHAMIMLCGRQIDRTGNPMMVIWTDRVLLWTRVFIVVAYTASVFLFGWLDQVRSWLGGDLVFVDEALALLPPLIAFVLGWFSAQPIDRRLREAMILHELDGGQAVHAPPARWSWVMNHVRHQMLLILVPIAALLSWTELFEWCATRATERWPALDQTLMAALGFNTVHLLGVLLVLMLMPPVIVCIWDTAPLGPGPMRDRLSALCQRQRVRCRKILIWRTHNTMLNGAVMGLVAPLRYILLTDALLDQLTREEVEAVMAHEVAHARRHHLPWMILAMGASIGLAWSGAAGAIFLLFGDGRRPDGSIPELALFSREFGALAVALPVALLVFGYISRRFEQQADAFAAQHLSGVTPETGPAATVLIEPHAATAMAGALLQVARLNHIPIRRFSFRHGSIASRRRRVLALIGAPARSLPIDRTVRRIKLITILALLLLGALFAGDVGLMEMV